jgi:hypothetical protein
MPHFAQRGRPPISTFCVDCFREGLTPETGAQPKRYGSYCAKHMYARQNVNRLRQTAKREVVLGHWEDVSEDAQEALIQQCEENIALCYKKLASKGKAATVAFEYDCMRLAIGLRRRITRREEDEIIITYGGSRTGRDPYAIRVLGPPDTRPVDSMPNGPVLLPNPVIRQKHRAELYGGPTTEGEPDFAAYYRAEYSAPVPEEFRSEDDTVVASDGREVAPSQLDWYEDFIKKNPKERLNALHFDVEASYEEEGVPPDVNASFSQMMEDE